MKYYLLTRLWSLSRLHSTAFPRYFNLSNRFLSSAKDGFVTIGNVSSPLKKGNSTHLVPTIYKPEHVPQSIIKHLQWMMQKDLLKQDMFLIGPPGPLRRNIAMMYLEIMGKEFEYISLSRDTTESDLKQRRELIAGTATHAEQCAVKAALLGRVLILDGVEKAERNVLPVLNNLLENREMQLEDGRFLVSAERYDKLLQTHTPEQLQSMKIVKVHPDFRVIALGLPVPQYRGNPLDPPFRSRFQGRSIDHLSYQDYLKCLCLEDELWKLFDISKLLSFGIALKTEEAKQLNLINFPFDNLTSIANILKKVPHLNSAKVIERLYPHQYFPKEAKNAVDDLLKTIGLAQESPTLSQLESIQCSSTNPNEALINLKMGSKDSSFEVACGDLLSSSSSPPYLPSFVSTRFHDDLLSELLITHSAGDFCVVGPRGCGKSSLISRFAELLGYETENIMLYQDMTSRDLLQQRTMNSSGDTGWRHSSLIDASLKGRIAVLDGLHRIHPSTLSILHRLIQDRELDLFDGTRLLRHDRYDHMKEANNWSDEEMNGRKLLRIHPSFRIVCLSEPPSFTGSNSSNWLTSELLASFLYHPMRQMTPQEESEILRHLIPNYSRMEPVLKFANQLRITANNQHLNSLASSLSTRQMVRLAKRLSSFKDDNIHHLLNKACLTRFLPSMVRESFEEEMNRSIKIDEGLKDKEMTCEVKDGWLRIGNTMTEVGTSTEMAKIPDVLFYDNEQHLKVMEDMLKDFMIGEHLLLIGNQGVGKNKVVDRFLNLLSKPREYIQLHRDTTVQTLTVQPTVRGGVVEYEDSPLVKAVKNGRFLVVDEADKAPTNVTCILKCLIESGFMHLPDGRKIVPASSNIPESPLIIKTHPDFRVIVLANRPGFPFLGNDFFGTMGDLFGTHAVDNPDATSELSMLRKYGPSVDGDVLRKIVDIFGDLRGMADRGEVSYPFSTREAVSIVKHLEMFPGDGLSRVVRNVFDFDSYDSELQKVITEVMHKHGIPIGASPTSVKLSKEFPLPTFKFQESIEAVKIFKDFISERTNFKIENLRSLECRRSKVDFKGRRSLIFREEESLIDLPLIDGSTVVQLAVTQAKQRQTFEKIKGDVIHALSINPMTLYSLDLITKSLTLIDIELLLPRGYYSLNPKIINCGETIVFHDGKSPVFHLINTNSGHARKVMIGDSRVSDFIFKNKSKKNESYKMLKTDDTSDGRVVFYKEGSDRIEIFDLINNICYSNKLPFQVGKMFSVSAGNYMLNESSSNRMYLMRENQEDNSQYELLFLQENENNFKGMDFISDSPLSNTQLSSLLDQKIDSPNRIISTNSSFASVVLGLPDCTTFDIFQSSRSDFGGPNLPSLTETTYLPTNGVVVRVVSANHVPPSVFGKDILNTRVIIGFLEVVDVVNKTLRYIPIPGSHGTTESEKWHLENQFMMNKSSRTSNPNNILLSRLSGQSLCSLDKLGHLRLWELMPVNLSASLKKWRDMIGEGDRHLQITHEKEDGKAPTELPKHGKVDPTGAPHVGGSTWAGGTGGRSTAGLGGVGGPYRLDGGTDVYQVSDEVKASVPAEILEAARQMGLRAWKERLKEVEMSEYDGAMYESFVSPVRPHIKHMRTVLDSLQAKSKERQWLRHQMHGDVDEGKLIEGVIGEKGVYKRRGEKEPEAGSLQEKPKLMRIVCDVSGSMYRFNGHDGRMDRQLESLLMVMEAFNGYEQKIVYEVFGHSGEGPSFPFVKSSGYEGGSKAPKNDKQRLDVALNLMAHSQFCISGDHTMEATKVAIDNVSKMEDVDERFVIILSDANFERYGINPQRFGQLLTSDPNVNAYVIFIGSLGDQAQRLLSKMPTGHSFICKESKQLPGIMHQIFLCSLLS